MLSFGARLRLPGDRPKSSGLSQVDCELEDGHRGPRLPSWNTQGRNGELMVLPGFSRHCAATKLALEGRLNVNKQCMLWAGLMGSVLSTDILALGFSSGSNDFAFDTILTYGVSLRAEKPDPTNLAAYGNRNFDKWDVFSHVVKASHDFQWTNSAGFGGLLRGNYFYDFAAADADLAPAADNRAVHHGDITDAVLFAKLGGDNQYTVKLGKQVISWGESTFIGGSLNDINTVDVTKLRQPGVQLKDALVGTPGVLVSWQATPRLAFEGFALVSFDEIKIDPSGTYFSTTDALSDGGGNGLTPDGGLATLGPLSRSGDDIPSGGGQYGVSLRYFAPNLGADFGLYYEKLHEHSPTIAARPGSHRFYLRYVEDVERYGASFNASIGKWAVGGEYSYRPNASLQTTQFFFAALGVPGMDGSGYTRIPRSQVQVTGQRQWAEAKHWLGADSFDTIGEAAYGWVDLPDKTRTAFNPVTDTFWGFVVRNSLTYNNVFNLVNLVPNLSFSWDVDGVSNDGVFVEGRKSAGFGLDVNWKLNWSASVAYTAFWNGTHARNNLTGSRVNTSFDRDFISANLSYSF